MRVVCQVALSHLYSMGKSIIGTGGLGNDEHGSRIMHILNAGVLSNIAHDNSVEVFGQFVRGECSFQQSDAPGKV